MNQTDATIVYSVAEPEKKLQIDNENTKLESDPDIRLELYNPSFEEFTGIKIQGQTFENSPGVRSQIFTLKDIKETQDEGIFGRDDEKKMSLHDILTDKSFSTSK